MKLRITVEGQAYEVEVEVLEGGTVTGPPAIQPLARPAAAPAPAAPAAPPAKKPAAAKPVAGGSDKVLTSPIAGTITQVKVKVGDQVAINQVLLVMEAMKMETNIASPVAATVKSVTASVGDAVKQGQVLVEFA